MKHTVHLTWNPTSQSWLLECDLGVTDERYFSPRVPRELLRSRLVQMLKREARRLEIGESCLVIGPPDYKECVPLTVPTRSPINDRP